MIEHPNGPSSSCTLGYGAPISRVITPFYKAKGRGYNSTSNW